MATQPFPESPAQPTQPVQPDAPPPEVTPIGPDVDIPDPGAMPTDPAPANPI